MKTRSIPSLLLSAFFLVLMSCTETPTGLDPANSNLYGAGIDARVSLNAPQQGVAQAQGSLIVVHVPRQTVDALRDGQPTQAQVGARIRIGPDGTAEGELRWRSREDGQVVIRALTGRSIFDPDGAFVRAELEFREANGERVAATVTPSTTDPDCLIWDLINGESGAIGENNFPEQVSFEASGEIRVHDGSR